MFSSLLIVFTFGQIGDAANWSPQMVSNYFSAIQMSSVDAILCSAEDGIQLLQTFTQNIKEVERPIPLRTLDALNSDMLNDTSLGIFIDLLCNENQQLLTNIQDDDWFGSNLHWLIWDESEFLNSIDWAVPVSTYSEVAVIVGTEIHKLHRIWRSLPIKVINSGHWDADTNEVFFNKPHVMIDLQGSSVRGSITFFEDIYDKTRLPQQLQNNQFRPGDDILNRLFYANDLLLSYLYNFELELVNADNWGSRYDNGTWTGMLGMLQRGEIDLSVTPMLPISQRMEVSIPTLSLCHYWYAVVFKQPRALGTYKAMILELSSGAWACVAVLVLIGAITFSITQRHESDPDPSYDYDGTIAMGLVQSVGIIANQGLCLMPNGTSSRMVCLCLLMVGLIVSTYYSAATTTALLSESPPVIQDLDQLLSSNIPLLFRNATYVRHVEVRRRVFPEKIWRLMDKNLKMVELCEGTQSILNGSAFFDEYFGLFQNINAEIKSDIICDLSVFKAGSFSSVLSFIKKDNHFRELYVSGLIRLLETGLSDKERQRWVAERLGCSRIIEFIQVHMGAVSVAFGILALGFILSTTFFILEIVFFRRSNFLPSNGKFNFRFDFTPRDLWKNVQKPTFFRKA